MQPYFFKNYILKRAVDENIIEDLKGKYEDVKWQGEKALKNLRDLWAVMTEYPFEKRFAGNILYKIFGYDEKKLDEFLQKLTGKFYEKFDKISPDELKKMVFEELTGTPLEELVTKYRTLLTEIPHRRATLKNIESSGETILEELQKNLDDIKKMQDLINERYYEYANTAAYFKEEEPLLKALKRIGRREWKYGGLKGKAKVLGGALGTLGLLGGLYSSLSRDLGGLFSPSQTFEKQSSLFEKKADNEQEFWGWFNKFQQTYEKEKTLAKEWEKLGPLRNILHYYEPVLRGTKKKAADVLLKIFGKDKILEWAKTLGDPAIAEATTPWERLSLLFKNPSIYTEEPKLDSDALKNLLRDEILRTEGIEGMEKIKTFENIAEALAEKIEGKKSYYDWAKGNLRESIKKEKLNLESAAKRKQEIEKMLNAFKSEGFLDAIARIAKREWGRELPGKAKVLGGLGLLGYSLYGLGSSLFGNKE